MNGSVYHLAEAAIPCADAERKCELTVALRRDWLNGPAFRRQERPRSAVEPGAAVVPAC